MSANIYNVLKDQFQLSEFRPLQEEVITHVLAEKSALVLMPTGSGKSLTYQLPSLMLQGTTLVISPLKALMKDQVDKLRELKIKAGYVNSDVSKPEREKRQAQLAKGGYQIFYITPERFRKDEFLAALKDIKIALLVVDEAHCISQWGHDFRPDYAKVGQIRKALGQPTVLALTATATAQVQKDILQILQIEPAKTFALPIARPNLAIKVFDIYGLDEKVKIAREFISPTGSTVIYFSLIQSLHNFSRELQKHKINHEVYHGNLAEPLKRRAQENFLKGQSRLILATPAFGLGIDKSDVRCVIHAELPGAVESYFQEIGRAGRDGERADCVLLYDQDDVSTQMEFIKWSHPEATFITKVYELIRKNPERVRQEGADFLREQMNFHNKRDFRVETVINLLTSWGVLEGWSIVAELDPLFIDETSRQARFKRQNEKLLSMVQYVNTSECRMQYIYNYFSEINHKPCGLCDNCENA